MSRSGILAAATLVFLLFLGCGGGSGGGRPVDAPLAVGSAKPTPSVATAPAAVPRPRQLALWVHVDDVDALVDIFGVTHPGSALASVGPIITGWLALVDTRVPLDIAVSASGGKAKDGEVAVRLPLRDVKAFVKKLAAESLYVQEEKDRIVLKRGAEDEKEIAVCQLSPASNGPEVAICGTAAGVAQLGDWLRSAPVPTKEERAREAKGDALLRATIYYPPVRALAKSSDDENRNASAEKKEDAKDLEALVDESESLTFELDRDDKELAFAIAQRFSTIESKIARSFFVPSAKNVPGDEFARVWQDTSAVVFLPGAGPLPAWLTDVKESKDVPTALVPKRLANNLALLKLFEKPISAGYGVRIERAKAALAAARATKDPSMASKNLEKALDSYLVAVVAADLPTMEKNIRDLVVIRNAEKPKPPEGGGPPPVSNTKSVWSTRPAPSSQGLPKGSFYYDERKTTKEPKGPPKVETDSSLFFGEGTSTWMITCSEDIACVEVGKKILATKPGKQAADPLFARQGVIVSGYASSLVGAFAMHKASPLLGALHGGASKGVTSDELAELEHDLTAQRLPLPFALSAQKQGKGGVVTFEVHGQREAFHVIGEHVTSAIGPFLTLAIMLMAMSATGHP